MEAYDTLDSTRIDYLPRPHEIRAACAIIRQTWTTSERRRRYVGPDVPDEISLPWHPPTIDTSCFRLATLRMGTE